MTAKDLIEQLCKDLNQAHDKIMEGQELDPAVFDWPEWTSQANSIRIAEKLLGKKLAKTNNWTIFPTVENPELKNYPEHNTDSVKCWCEPKIETLENGNKVVIHRVFSA